MNASEPPVNPSHSPRIAFAPREPERESLIPGRPPTIADVAMRIAVDMPVYLIIVVTGVLAMRGTATSLEAIVAAFGALLSKMWPRPVQTGVHQIVIFILIGARVALGPVDLLATKQPAPPAQILPVSLDSR